MCFFPRTTFSDTDYFITIAFKTYFIVHPLDIIVYSKKLEQNVLLVCPCIFSLENTNNYFSFLGGKMEPKEKQSFSSQFQSSFMIEIVRNRLSVIYRLPASLHSFFFFFPSMETNSRREDGFNRFRPPIFFNFPPVRGILCNFSGS